MEYMYTGTNEFKKEKMSLQSTPSRLKNPLAS